MAKNEQTNQRILNFIDGQYTAGSGTAFEDRNPADNSLVAMVEEAGSDEVEQAVTAARKAIAGDWGRTNVQQRAALLNRVAGRILERKEEFVAAEMADTGKLLGPTAGGEIPRAAEQFRSFAAIAATAPTESFETVTPDGRRAINYVQRAPKGVVASICPWNLPFILLTWKVAPALACGNAVIVKPSEETPATAALLGEIMNEAGVPAGVYNVLHGFGPGSAGELLTQHPGVDAITFTGETGTGEAIMKQAAVGARDISLELGGKNAGIVFDDCDLDHAVRTETMAVFHNCGQICLGNERLYVQRSIFDAFVSALAGAAQSLSKAAGDPRDSGTRMSPLISLGHREKVLKFYAAAREDGAELRAGGGIPNLDQPWSEGSWIQPTIWTGLAQQSRVVQEEVFGPCCAVIPFDDEEEAVALANDSKYGLTATVHSRDINRANRVASRLNVGVVWVNGWMIRDLRTPFGGVKHSGIGREGGASSLHFYSESRNICVQL